MAIRYWLGVMHRENVRVGRASGFAQASRDTRELFQGMGDADGLVYYSPRTDFDGDPLQEFTAIGYLADGRVYQESGQSWRPWRRRVDYDREAVETSIRPLVKLLDFSRDDLDWGRHLRRGLLEISRHDFELIRQQMRRPTP